MQKLYHVAGMFVLVMSLSSVAQVQVYTGDDTTLTGWTQCIPGCNCSPGGTGQPTTIIQQIVTTPSLDNESMQFTSGGPANTNMLWTRKYPANTTATHFIRDFEFQYSGTPAQLEFDIASFAAPTEFMFGMQCNLAKGIWQVWNQASPQWVNTTLSCTLSAQAWHHIVQYVHISGTNMVFDAISVDGTINQLNMTEPSGPLPPGWNNVTLVQNQLNLAVAGTATEFLDEDTFSVLP